LVHQIYLVLFGNSGHLILPVKGWFGVVHLGLSGVHIRSIRVTILTLNVLYDLSLRCEWWVTFGAVQSFFSQVSKGLKGILSVGGFYLSTYKG